jgi:hypothetical protein
MSEARPLGGLGLRFQQVPVRLAHLHNSRQLGTNRLGLINAETAHVDLGQNHFTGYPARQIRHLSRDSYKVNAVQG